ncbi:MAG: hypothetical protein CLLPBCKN_003866 [Chroococcidiopsis cubana SAG 39.79]|nr:hypothetical protein [Chroococcidiopsis cubana SAG 39.79]
MVQLWRSYYWVVGSFGQQLRAEIARVEAIRESEKRYQELFELAPRCLFSLTPDGTIQSANQFSAEYLGYSQEELLVVRLG